jgi:flavin-dependent dehydrogenase
MKIHIIGAGPTGMTVAWELLSTTPCDVTIYDKKLSAGGSWWEPSSEYRDLHAHRIAFDRAFINTRNLFKEMNIQWNDVFEPVEYNYGYIFKHMSFSDYLALGSLALKVLALPWKYEKVTLKDALGESMTTSG